MHFPESETVKPTALYYITHKPTGRIYIGITCQALRERWRMHLKAAKTGVRMKIAAAIAKYGAEAFEISTQCVFPTYEAAAFAERVHIARHKPHFNITKGGGGTLGRKHTPEAIAKMKAAKADISEETRARVSAGLRASPRAVANGKKQADAINSKPRSEASKAKQAATMRGRKLPEAHKEAIRLGHLRRLGRA